MKNEKITFAIDEINLIQEISDSQLAIAEVKVCHSGMNLHQMPISLSALKQAEPTIINKWLVAGFDGVDFKGHEGKAQMIIGFFPKENNFRYIEEDDKTYFLANAIVSKMYAEWAFDILKDSTKECSMEITLAETEQQEDGYEWITSYVYNGVTVLGKTRNAACPGSEIELVNFSTDEFIEKTEKILAEFSSSNNEENLNINNNINTQEKEVEQMVFNKEEFAVQFSMTANDVMEMMRDACGQMKYQVEDREYSKYWMIDYDASYMYAYNEEGGENSKSAIPYSIEEGKVKCDFENAKPCKTMSQWVIMEENDDDSDSVMMAIAKAKEDKEKFAKANEEPEDNNNDEGEQNMSADDNQDGADEMKEKFTQMETKLNDMEEKFSTLSQTNEELTTENEQLKKFKSDIEENDKNAKIEFALQEAVELGMPKETADEFRTKALEFNAENIHIWVNEVKANTLDFAKVKKEKENENEGFIKVGLSWTTGTEKKKGLWS